MDIRGNTRIFMVFIFESMRQEVSERTANHKLRTKVTNREHIFKGIISMKFNDSENSSEGWR